MPGGDELEEEVRRVLLALENVAGDRMGHGGGPSRLVQLGEDVCDMPVDGLWAHREHMGDLLVGESVRDAAENFPLSLGEVSADAFAPRRSAV